MKRFLLLAASLAALCCALLPGACATKTPVVPAVEHPMPTSPGYFAGVAVADITPALHLSLFGHGPEGRIAAGVRLRLDCQVFVLATATDVVALVPCDLQSPSLALQRAVAENLERSGIPITADRLFIMATHTHAGPAHYFEARRYSGSFSSQAPGYDQHVVDFLAGRISAGVAEAYASLAPACLAWNQRKLEGFTFNRSYVPFLADPDGNDTEYDPTAKAKEAERTFQTATSNKAPSPPPAPTGSAAAPPPDIMQGPGPSGAELAVDPRLSVLAIYGRAADATTCDGAALKGVLAVYGMHPTGVPNTNDLYHGDIFGFAARAAEGRLSSAAPPTSLLPLDLAAARQTESACPDGARVVVGVANGVEGDVSPKLIAQSFPDARRHGRALGQAIAELVKEIPLSAKHAAGPVTHLSWDLRFPGGTYDDAGHKLCVRAELGMAAAGGARDGPTRLRIIPAANAGFQPNRLSACHDQKLPMRAGGSSEYDFPEVGPIGLVHVDDGVFATIPGEATTMTGDRIRRAILQRLPPSLQTLALVGLTNQYFQYFATHEEYPYQYYEGASTLYGPHSEEFLVRYFGCLADKLAGRTPRCKNENDVNVPWKLDADPSPPVSRWPADEDVDVLSLNPLTACKVRREGALGWEMNIDALPLTFTSNRADLSIQVLPEATGTVSLDDDRGASIEVRELDVNTWRVRWIPDLDLDPKKPDARCGRTYRLAVRGRVSLTSQPFVLHCDPAPERCGP